jgi:hypothetical protein
MAPLETLMYGIRRELARMREQVGGRYILLSDGSRYRYVRDEIPIELFKHAGDAARADYRREPRPEPPEILRIITLAKNRRAAVTQIYPEWETRSPFSAYDLWALIETGELVHAAFCDAYPPITEEGEGN